MIYFVIEIECDRDRCESRERVLVELRDFHAQIEGGGSIALSVLPDLPEGWKRARFGDSIFCAEHADRA